MRSGYNNQVSSSPVKAEASDTLLHASSDRRALAGLCLSGLLASLLGAILPAWGYHLAFQFSTIGYYFLSVALGVTASVQVSRRLLPRKGISFVLTLACSLACGALIFLAFAPPPYPVLWRLAMMLFVGIALGLLNSASSRAFSVSSTTVRRPPLNLVA